jgi:hypothetical protein
MGKDYFILNNGRVFYGPGHYEEEVAENIARRAAENNPGRTYTVVQIISKFQKPKENANGK